MTTVCLSFWQRVPNSDMDTATQSQIFLFFNRSVSSEKGEEVKRETVNHLQIGSCDLL